MIEELPPRREGLRTRIIKYRRKKVKDDDEGHDSEEEGKRCAGLFIHFDLVRIHEALSTMV